MFKAFDSIGIYPIEHAFQRLKIPSSTTNLLINIYKNRKLRIITDFGLTEAFQVEDRIDQGKSYHP